ncbi:nitrogenase component 1 [Geobacter pickeringii]|uniref:nitrogenase component 1 n=1 Tax=Geobacter pickeringii TaxID=345632 RepID=UPI00068C8A49|nr:nitrogenase component 1 [Geobacter pickeringii]
MGTVRVLRREEEFTHFGVSDLAGSNGLADFSYAGYERYLETVIDEILVEQPRERKLVTILGVVPQQHVFWRGSLRVLKELLARVGVEANIVFTTGPEALRRISAAELTLVFSSSSGLEAAKKFEKRFGIPFAVFASVPVGPRDTNAFLRIVGKMLRLREARIEEVIAAEGRYSVLAGDCVDDTARDLLLNAPVGIVADSPTAVGLARYGANELGWQPEIVVITDNPPEESRGFITRNLTDGIRCPVIPRVFFETDPWRIRHLLQEHSLQFVLASSREKAIAANDLNATLLSVAFPVHDRIIIDRTYAGYRGGLALIEDVAFAYGQFPRKP